MGSFFYLLILNMMLLLAFYLIRKVLLQKCPLKGKRVIGWIDAHLNSYDKAYFVELLRGALHGQLLVHQHHVLD